MNKMVATVTIIPRIGVTESQLSEYLRTSMGDPWEGNPIAQVTEVAVSAMPSAPPDDAVPAAV